MVTTENLIRLQKLCRVMGLTVVGAFLVWCVLPFAFDVPTIIDVFGIGGLKMPGSALILSLLLCAFGFEKFN